MIIAAAVLVTLAHLLPVAAYAAVQRKVPGDDVMHPLVVLGALGLLNVPYLFMIARSTDQILPEVLNSPWIESIEIAVARFALLTSVLFIATGIGVLTPWNESMARRIPVISSRITPRRCYIAIAAGLGIGGAFYAYFLRTIGGLGNLWLNLYSRTQITAGTGYLGYAYSTLLTLAACIAVYTLAFRDTRTRRVAITAIVILVAAVLASTGGRAGAVNMVLFCVFTLHYGVRRVQVVSTRNIMAGAALVAFVIVLPTFRTAGAVALLGSDRALLAESVMASANSLPSRLSRVDRHLVTVSYFTPDRRWWGRSYADLLQAPIPRTRFPDKPPVDEGVYLKAIAEGRSVTPSMPAHSLPATSWPPGSFILYMNFGVAGLVVGGLVAGVIIGMAYQFMRQQRTPGSIFVYAFLVTGGLGFSNYGIVRLVMVSAFSALLLLVCFGSLDRERLVARRAGESLA